MEVARPFARGAPSTPGARPRPSPRSPLVHVSQWVGRSSQRVTEVYAYLVPEQREWGGVFSIASGEATPERAKGSLRIPGRERTQMGTRPNDAETSETQKPPSQRREGGLRGAEHGTRTRDLNLGKVALYQLS